LDNNIFVSYYDDDNRDLKFAKSTDGGAAWLMENIRTVDSSGYVGKYTSLCAAGDCVFIAYYDETNGSLKFAKSIDGGNTW